MRPTGTFAERFLSNLRALGVAESPERWVVGVSGGCDSVALLFLLRFCARQLPLDLVVAHLDHAMRPGSEGDARWVAGLCEAWEVPLVGHRLPDPPSGEDAARRQRYQFLRSVASQAGARWIAVGHHADDQAETVLFRALRGTGLEGLGGMRAVTAAGIVRPLLPFWREEVHRFAREHRLRWRTDPSNLSLDPVRNRIRLELLPAAERAVSGAARRNLVALAALAREAEDALAARAEAAEREAVRAVGGGFVLARARVRDYDSATGSRLIRTLLRRFGVVPSRSGTRTALQFITDAPSGRELQLPGGVRVRLEFDEARVERAAPAAPDSVLPIADGTRPGRGALRIGGARYRVRWSAAPSPERGLVAWSAALDASRLHFPLTLRGWMPGDRMWTTGGTKPLKKLFLEHRVPRQLRRQLPVLVDRAGAVLWVAGVPRAPALAARDGEQTLFLTVLNA